MQLTQIKRYCIPVPTDELPQMHYVQNLPLNKTIQLVQWKIPIHELSFLSQINLLKLNYLLKIQYSIIFISLKIACSASIQNEKADTLQFYSYFLEKEYVLSVCSQKCKIEIEEIDKILLQEKIFNAVKII